MGELAAFIILALVTLIPAVVVVTSKNIVRSALSLIPTFLGVTGIYILLSAEFVAGIQVLIYAGAITVLILFVIMLTEGGTGVRVRQVNEQVPLGATAAVWLGFLAGHGRGAAGVQRRDHRDRVPHRLRRGVRGHQPGAAGLADRRDDHRETGGLIIR